MDTKTAATEAKVTIATIRSWARNGVITATKQAGRWVIDAGSLAHRLAIAALKAARRTPKAIALTVENLTAIGGRLWEKNGMRRVYINDWTRYLPLEIEQYKTGNISWAAWNGEEIANRQALLLLGSLDKVWFDTADGKLHARLGSSESRVATRSEVFATVNAGIRAAVAAL
ncbi:hypothetical protein [Actinacidiphila acididurans]|uniref:DNA-binding protein n=1 Tax=Actinacidiphila acididurans TaxID=2784346 RepID=A0ABS2U3Z4_9ACTN|nr:hypothetical protein [Actinacidiphila acididurans]MBM9510057.1 hypothetical protein [Actinacidiphila acididurans]